jgi:hypothetical protein
MSYHIYIYIYLFCTESGDHWAGYRDWSVRLRKINHANPKPPSEYVMAWVLEAAPEE